MHIIKAPLRISLFGGGTDLPEYYEENGSTIISMAIDKYMYLTHNPRPTGGYRLTYSKVEELHSLTNAKHTIISQSALDYGDPEPCTLSIVSDVPKGTGLGSSSALAVCAYKLFQRDRDGHESEMAHAAYQIERQVSNCGAQDHLPATFGGFNVYTIGRDGRATARPVPGHLVEMVNKYGLLLYTRNSRPADKILETWKKPKSTFSLHSIHRMARDEMRVWFGTGADIYVLASSLNATWHAKREIGGVTNPELDTQYDIAIDAGALGGKLLGAGGGGCWFFLVMPESRQRVIDATGLVEIPFQVDPRGVREMRF